MASIIGIFANTMDEETFYMFSEHIIKFRTVLRQLMHDDNEYIYYDDIEDIKNCSLLDDEYSDNDDYNEYRYDYYSNRMNENYDSDDEGGLYGEYDDWEDYYDSVYN